MIGGAARYRANLTRFRAKPLIFRRDRRGDQVRWSSDFLTGFATDALVAVGVPAVAAATTAARLVEAEARGRTGHGLIRLPSYVRRIQAGGVDPRAIVAVCRETPVSALVDGGNGLGQVVMTAAAEIAIAKAAEHGLAWVGTVNSNHAGAAGLYVERAAARGLVGVYFAVANANGMPPWGGVVPLLGTNPIAIAVPTARHPFVLDIASTAASHGTIAVTARAGGPLPEGWLLDAAGRPVTDPARVAEGLLVPIGGHKGSGLTVAIGLLAGVLNGAAFGAEVIDHRADLATPTNTGQAMLVLRPDLFRPREVVIAELTRHLDALRASGTADGRPVRLPGDEAARRLAESERLGVELAEHIAADLDALAGELGLPARLRDQELHRF
jgi:L-2-hydroxycarboxylate dehydrogenase (NAD+)